MIKHMKSKHKNVLKCTVCGKVLSSNIDLKKHMETDHNIGANPEALYVGLDKDNEETLPEDEQCKEILRILDEYSEN